MPLNVGNFPLFSLFGIIISGFLMFNLNMINIVSGTIGTIVIMLLYYAIQPRKK